MNQLSKITRPGVGQYVSDPQALSYLDQVLSPFKKVFVVTGQKAFAAFCQHYKGSRQFTPYYYDQTSSKENMTYLASLAPQGTDVVLAIGGGKLLDTAKGVADILKVDYITIPTVLGTCAAYTPLSVIYKLDHSFSGVDYYQRAAYACLADLTLLSQAPVDYLYGGVGDTLAKWYEAKAIVDHLEKPWSALVDLGLASANLTQTILLRDSAQAIESCRKQKVCPAFHRVVDAILTLGGSVGGFAGEYGRMSGAHAIHNGMSLLAETHEFQHGVKVAYGILVQLATFKDYEQLATLLPFYKANGFYSKLSHFNVHEDLEAKIDRVASYAVSKEESFVLADPQITKEAVITAMHELENYEE